MSARKGKSTFLTALLNPSIQPFLNKRALVTSDEFQAVLETCIAQYSEDRNWDRLRKIALIFSRSKYFHAVTQFIADYAALRYSIKGEQGLYFIPIKDELPKPRYRDFANYLNDRDLQHSLSDLKAKNRTKKKAQSGGGDAMLRRFPGSFETSK